MRNILLSQWLSRGIIPGRWNLSEWNLSESTLSESTFWPNRNLSEWNLSEGIIQKIFSAKAECLRMESFRKNISENIFSLTGIFQNGIFQKESFRKHFQ
jgi:hypothetical protein